jgi:hypothetical protein
MFKVTDDVDEAVALMVEARMRRPRGSDRAKAEPGDATVPPE